MYIIHNVGVNIAQRSSLSFRSRKLNEMKIQKKKIFLYITYTRTRHGSCGTSEKFNFNQRAHLLISELSRYYFPGIGTSSPRSDLKLAKRKNEENLHSSAATETFLRTQLITRRNKTASHRK